MIIWGRMRSMHRANWSVSSFFSQSIPAIIDRPADSIAIRYVAGGDMDNNALQRAAASVMQESLRECFAHTERFPATREIRDYLPTLLTSDNKEDFTFEIVSSACYNWGEVPLPVCGVSYDQRRITGTGTG
jgi:hypothetical protein